MKCNTDEYECRLSKQCVRKELRCDGKFDCLNGKEDELDCSKRMEIGFNFSIPKYKNIL